MRSPDAVARCGRPTRRAIDVPWVVAHGLCVVLRLFMRWSSALPQNPDAITDIARFREILIQLKHKPVVSK